MQDPQSDPVLSPEGADIMPSPTERDLFGSPASEDDAAQQPPGILFTFYSSYTH